MKRLLFILLLTVTFVLTALPGAMAQSKSSAQPLKEGESLDKIVAVVGNEIILLSDLKGRIQLYAQQNPGLDVTAPELRAKVLDALVNEKLIVTKAIEDSINVGEDEITQRWDLLLHDLVQYYGSDKRVEDVYGMSISRLQYEYRDVIKKQLMIDKIQYQMFGSIKLSQREVNDFYNEYRDSIPMIPTQVDICHIVKNVKANTQAKESTYNLAKAVRDSLINGANFKDFAKRYSQDPGTANDGGELGWFAKGKLLAEFEKAAFDLAPGQLSMPIETPFGYHIIQTLDKRKDSVRTKHILFKITQTTDDRDAVIKSLNDLKAKVEKGADFDSLARIESDDKDTKGFGGLIGRFELANLPPNVKDIADKLSEKGISDPVAYGNDPTKPSYRIVYKKKIIAEHKATLQDDYKILEQKGTMWKQMKMYQEWIETLRKTMYWEIKN